MKLTKVKVETEENVILALFQVEFKHVYYYWTGEQRDFTNLVMFQFFFLFY